MEDGAGGPALHVLHVDAGRGWRGGQRQALLLMEGLRARGHRARGAFRTGAPLARAAGDAGFDVLPIAPRAELDLSAARALRRRLREDPPDVVHAHDAHGTATALLAARGLAPVLASRRVALPPRRNPLSLLKLRSVSRWLAISGAARDALLRAGVDPRRVDVVHSGIPEHGGSPEGRPPAAAGTSLRDRLGLSSDAFLILAAGRLEPPKGQRTFLEACALAGPLPGARWVVAGEGPDRPFLERLADELGVRDRVVFAGQVADLPARIGEAQLCVHASFSEGLGGVLLDAMAAGVPVVATVTGGIPEVVRDGVEGLLVPAGDARSIAEAVRRLALDPALRAAMGGRGRLRAREFGIEATVERTLAAYRAALAARGTTGGSPAHAGRGRRDTAESTA